MSETASRGSQGLRWTRRVGRRSISQVVEEAQRENVPLSEVESNHASLIPELS